MPTTTTPRSFPPRRKPDPDPDPPPTDHWTRPLALGLLALVAVLLFTLAGRASAAGTLTPAGAGHQPIEMRDHHVNVTINNGFARTEVLQTFFNPNPTDLEAVYSFPVPRSASLSEMTITAGERELHGEVVAKAKAQQVYEDEKSKGNDAGLAEKHSYQRYEFRVYPVPAAGETKMRFVYYQPIDIDTGVGRYVYPLAEGNTDEQAMRFWSRNERVRDMFSFDVELKSGAPVADVRVTGFGGGVNIDQPGEGHYRLHGEQSAATLDQDLVVYYKLAEGQPGRVELLTHRPGPDGPGTFMMVLTPGVDLKPIQAGRDFLFVLDTSGSMQGQKLDALKKGVSQAISKLGPGDRYNIVSFANRADRVTRGWVDADPAGQQAIDGYVDALNANGSTNMYEGLQLALGQLDDDRPTCLVLVTDAVTNTGVVDPPAFAQLMQQYDVRVFGFLMGNGGNWPLMRNIADTSGGFHERVSTSDDIVGQVLLGASKITHEALLNAELSIRGVETFETSDMVLDKVYRGQQVVMFGRYDQGGRARITLDATLTGEDKTYTTEFDFPDVATDHPELERLWALHRIEQAELARDRGLMPGEEAADIVRDLGVGYQLVTDETSMLVVADDVFDREGIERRNRDRIATETAAQQRRAAQGPVSNRVDEVTPMFSAPAASPNNGGAGGGAGAIDPVTGLLVLGLGGAALMRRRRRSDEDVDHAGRGSA